MIPFESTLFQYFGDVFFIHFMDSEFLKLRIRRSIVFFFN